MLRFFRQSFPISFQTLLCHLRKLHLRCSSWYLRIWVASDIWFVVFRIWFDLSDILRFLRVTGGNLPEPAGNSHEVFIVRVRVDFFKPRDVSFYPLPNTLTKVTICCLWSQWWTLQIWFCSKKSWTVHCWLFKPLSRKHSSLKKSSLPSKLSGTGRCHLNLKRKQLKNGSYRAT